MSARGLEVIDGTVQKTYEWIKELKERLDWFSDRDVLRFLRITLHQVRDRVSIAETAQLSAQLPILIRGLFFEGWQPHLVPIPGTRRQEHLLENLGSLELELTAADLQELEAAFATMTVHGLRMDEENMRVIDGWPVSTI